MSGYAVCRRCSAVYPERQGCSACEAEKAGPAGGAAGEPFVVAADLPAEPLAARVRKLVRRSPSARWLLAHIATVGLLILAVATITMVMMRAGS